MVRARFLFDAGSGICLWTLDAPTRERFGYPIDHRTIGLSVDLVAAVDELLARYDSSIDWDDPGGPSPWGDEDHAAFERDAAAVLARIRAELGPGWEVTSG